MKVTAYTCKMMSFDYDKIFLISNYCDIKYNSFNFDTSAIHDVILDFEF